MDQPNNSSKKYHDIITKKADRVLILKEGERRNEMLREKNYCPILSILHKGPMTLENIANKYNATVEEGRQRKPKTIYRYIQDLKEAGLVIETGQRVTEGQQASNKLYARAAKVFFVEGWWKSGPGENLLLKLDVVLRKRFPDLDPDFASLKEWFTSFEKIQDQETIRLIESTDADVLEIMAELGACDSCIFYKILAEIVLILGDPEIHSKLKNCFKKRL